MLLSNNLQEKAGALINRMIKILGDNTRTYINISNLYREFGYYDELLKLYDEGIKKGYNFDKERINVYEIMGKYEKAIYNYLQVLNTTNYSYVLSKLLYLAEIEEQSDLVEKQLIALENTFTNKKEHILKLQIGIYLKFKQLSKLMNVIKTKYFPLNRIENSFLEGIINSLFSMKNYSHIIDIYKQIPPTVSTNINPTIKLRYAQSLYLFERFKESLLVLDSLQSKSMEDIKYYKALNHTGLTNYSQALLQLKGLNTYDSFNLNFKILILQNKFKDAKNLLSKGMKNKNFFKGRVAFNEIILNLFLNENVIVTGDIKKYLEIYPQYNEANDLALILFLLQNDFIKNNKENISSIMNFFKFYYLNNFKQAASSLIKLQFPAANLDSIIKYFLAKSYVNINDNDKAIIELEIITHKKTFVKPYALELLGWIYMYKKNNPGAAKKYFKQILAEHPSFVNINNIRKLLTN